MKKTIQFLYVMCVALLLSTITGCGSTGYSVSSGYYHGNSSYYHGNSWRYDNYYRSGVNNHYNRSAAANRSGGAARAGAAARSGGGGRAGGGGGGRR